MIHESYIKRCLKAIFLDFQNYKTKNDDLQECTCLLAGAPTNLSPSGVKAITDGVVRTPSAFSITLGVDPSITETQEFVVPKSIPMTWPLTAPDLETNYGEMEIFDRHNN